MTACGLKSNGILLIKYINQSIQCLFWQANSVKKQTRVVFTTLTLLYKRLKSAIKILTYFG